MEDRHILELYFQRDEAAISETAVKYGAFCHKIARNILSADADAEECVNDTWLQAWKCHTAPETGPVWRLAGQSGAEYCAESVE